MLLKTQREIGVNMRDPIELAYLAYRQLTFQEPAFNTVCEYVRQKRIMSMDQNFLLLLCPAARLGQGRATIHGLFSLVETAVLRVTAGDTGSACRLL